MADGAISWTITEQERESYLKMLGYFDKNQSGSLTDSEMHQVMQGTQLPKEVLAQVW